MDLSQQLMEREGVVVETLRPVDYRIASGMSAAMTEDGWGYND